MAVWIFNVFSSLFLVSVISLLLPEGKTAKFIKPFISLVLILIILTPIVDFNGLTEVDFATDTELQADEKFLINTARAKIDYLQENCVKIAKNNGISGAEFLIEYSVDENFTPTVSGVKIYLQKAVITEESEHIVILQRLKQAIAEYLSLSLTGVTIYE